MERVLIPKAPQESVLRHGENDPASRTNRLTQLGENLSVLSDVLKHIKASYDIEFIIEGDLSCIHLE